MGCEWRNKPKESAPSITAAAPATGSFLLAKHPGSSPSAILDSRPVVLLSTLDSQSTAFQNPMTKPLVTQVFLLAVVAVVVA